MGVFLLPAVRAGAEDGTVSIADYPALRAALADEPRGAASPVEFKNLWQEPDRYRGQRVEITGRVERRFRQPAVGTFPALAEVWIVDEQGNPSCLVFPAHGDTSQPGKDVRFTGTFLRLIRFRGGGDGERMAPLIVGPAAPVPITGKMAGGEPAVVGAWDRAVGLGLLVLVVVILGAQHLRLRRPRRPESGPPPSFFAPNGGSPPGEGEAGGGADVH